MTPSINSRILLDTSRHFMHHLKGFQKRTLELPAVGFLCK